MKKSQHGESKISIVLKKISYITFAMILIPTFVFADNKGSAENDSNQKVNVDQVINDINGKDGVYEAIRDIIGILFTAGFVIAIVKMMQIGINIMISSAGKKSDAKAALLPWAVGAAVCLTFGTVGPYIIDLFMGMSSGGVFDI